MIIHRKTKGIDDQTRRKYLASCLAEKTPSDVVISLSDDGKTATFEPDKGMLCSKECYDRSAIDMCLIPYKPQFGPIVNGRVKIEDEYFELF